MSLPFKLYFRRGEVREFFGFSEEAMTKLIRAGTIKPTFLKGDKQAYFARQDLLKLLPSEPTTPAPAAPPRQASHASASIAGKTKSH